MHTEKPEKNLKKKAPKKPLSKEEAQEKDAPIGTRLKKARQAKKLSIDQVSKALNIGKPYIDAIEKEDLSNMPALSFTLGFVRSMAVHYDLDPLEISTDFKHNLLQKDTNNDLKDEFKTIIPPQKPDMNYILIGSIIGLIAIAGAGYYLVKNLSTSL